MAVGSSCRLKDLQRSLGVRLEGPGWFRIAERRKPQLTAESRCFKFRGGGGRNPKPYEIPKA